jgi:hypothetical protein
MEITNKLGECFAKTISARLGAKNQHQPELFSASVLDMKTYGKLRPQTFKLSRILRVSSKLVC